MIYILELNYLNFDKRFFKQQLLIYLPVTL